MFFSKDFLTCSIIGLISRSRFMLLSIQHLRHINLLTCSKSARLLCKVEVCYNISRSYSIITLKRLTSCDSCHSNQYLAGLCLLFFHLFHIYKFLCCPWLFCSRIGIVMPQWSTESEEFLTTLNQITTDQYNKKTQAGIAGRPAP